MNVLRTADILACVSQTHRTDAQNMLAKLKPEHHTCRTNLHVNMRSDVCVRDNLLRKYKYYLIRTQDCKLTPAKKAMTFLHNVILS